MFSIQIYWVLEFAILYRLTVNVCGETCEGFTSPPLNASCILRREDNPTCHFELGDQNCGMGIQIVEYKNCPNEGRKCCQPCTRKVMHSTNCTASYCIYGRKSAGEKYKDGNCEYRSSEWGGCHPEILIRKREDTLLRTSISGSQCEPINVIEKVCGPDEVSSNSVPSQNQGAKISSKFTRTIILESSVTPIEIHCSYSTVSTWSTCHPINRTRTMLRKLNSGSSPQCDTDKTEVRPCFTNSGKERCFYTKWSRWSVCKNFIQQRKRNILYGKKADCRRTIKVKTCNLKYENSGGKKHRRHKKKKTRNLN